MENTKENLIRLFIIILGSFSAYYLSVLANKDQLDLKFIILIVLAISIIVWFLTNFLNDRILKLSKLKIESEYAFEKNIEGFWIEKYQHPETNKWGFGIILISYDDESRNLYLKGKVFDEDDIAFANWTSKSVYSDRNKKSILYIYDGEFKNERLSGNGYGKLDFNRQKGKTYKSGTGCFEDAFTKFKPFNFDIDKLDEDLCKTLTLSKIPETSIEKSNLIKKYSEYIKKLD